VSADPCWLSKKTRDPQDGHRGVKNDGRLSAGVISRHFSTLGATFDTRQRIFDLMVFPLAESRFPKARKATQKLILQLAVWERRHDMNVWSISTISQSIVAAVSWVLNNRSVN
jgi:hypothetical protein